MISGFIGGDKAVLVFGRPIAWNENSHFIEFVEGCKNAKLSDQTRRQV
jgi:hypothetical protein